ncbi:cytochrome p450 [Holotrichia oblita]|uniref:Cytochrome p450 n=1 Tax=Holotrichia oblita TaxID=644536 RepID=A0ACB9SNP6_HOLOL|nr:cytochrome p450 [Holotrichia oblita]
MFSFLWEYLWILILVCVGCLSYLVVKLLEPLHYWEKRNIPHLKPWPLIGNFQDVILRKRNFTYVVEDYYKAFPNKRYFGIHQFNIPSLVIRDLDLIKRITVKDFDHFTDHVNVIDTDLEPLFGKNLFSLTGQKWRDMRTTLSPSFTGNKIRAMFSLMSECAKQLNDYFLNKSEEVTEVEMKELMSHYTNDVIASCAFGVHCDSISDKDNTFYKMGRAVTAASIKIWIKSLIQILVPKLAKKFKITLISTEVSTFFDGIIRETIQSRKEKNIIRPDMIHLLMEAMKEGEAEDESKHVDVGFAAVDDVFQTNQKTNPAKQKLTIEDIIAQALIFFLAGFETASTLLSHCLHELAVNVDVQKRLQQEIDDAFKKSEGKDLTYECVANMKYLDIVISETLRKWPPAAILNRRCGKDFLIEGDETYGEAPFLLQKGLGLMIPVYGIHMDPKYFPRPTNFDPERFNDENKHNIVPYSYLPFGTGPRNCIGSRFALLESKTLLTYILSKFDVIPTAKTEIPLKLVPDTAAPCPKGFWLGLKKR